MRAGVVLMTYGAPRTLDDLPAYLSRIRGGRAVDDALVAEFRRRYETIGGSPLARITEAQADALERELGEGFRVIAAFRFAPPFVDERVRALAVFAPERVVGICLSPQWSLAIMGGYEKDLRAAADAHLPGVPVRMARDWYREPAFVDALAERVREALARLGDDGRTPLLLTAHSLPKRVFDREPDYVARLKETAELVAGRAGIGGRWHWAYQSAGHTREEWLRPDLKELFPTLAGAGHRRVLVVPVQFLADHLEVLYDLDVAAAAEARACGLEYHRIEMPNTQPAFIRALAGVVGRELVVHAV